MITELAPLPPTGVRADVGGCPVCPHETDSHDTIAGRDSRGAPVQESDLVFQVPLDDGQATIYGLTVLEPNPGGSVLGLATFDQWGPSMDPAAF